MVLAPAKCRNTDQVIGVHHDKTKTHEKKQLMHATEAKDYRLQNRDLRDALKKIRKVRNVV